MNKSWKESLIYQIYPRSFNDSNDDGIGDLNGILEKVEYLRDLGIDYVWISPFFKSPQKDFGYDIEDYRQVDPIFGTNEDLRRLVDELHNSNIKVLFDLVLSHTSDQHRWFKESSQQDENEFDDWYVWVDGDSQTPPNNWLSVFGGSAWKWHEQKQKFYLHNFLDCQPDLNFHNPDVQNQMLEEIKFWLEFGIDGFRFDVINFLFHDDKLRNNPLKNTSEIRPLGFNKDNPYGHQKHIYDNTRPETLAYLKTIRSLMDKYDAISIGEIVAENALNTVGEYSRKEHLHMAYCFEFLSEDFVFSNTDKIVEAFFQNSPDSWPCWSFSNHDSERIASRINEDPKEIMTKLLELKGTICIYQGEELGLLESRLNFKDLRDPFGKNFWPNYKGRDGCRTPMLWNSLEKHFGFSNHTPWLPADKTQKDKCVDIQEKDPNSMLNFSKMLIKRRLQEKALLHNSQKK